MIVAKSLPRIVPAALRPDGDSAFADGAPNRGAVPCAIAGRLAPGSPVQAGNSGAAKAAAGLVGDAADFPSRFRGVASEGVRPIPLPAGSAERKGSVRDRSGSRPENRLRRRGAPVGEVPR